MIGFKYNNEIYYYQKNYQNDITGIYDSSYNLVVIYKYDGWGKVLSVVENTTNNIGSINPFRYRSYYYDEETSLYYLNSRYYNPKWCRFINADGIIGANQDIYSTNLYIYASNNPVKYFDSDGEFVLTAFAICVGVGVAAGVAPTFIGDVAESIKNKKVTHSGWKAYASGAIGGAVGGAVGYLCPGAYFAPIVASSLTTSVSNSLLNKHSAKTTIKKAGENLIVDLTVGKLTKNIKIPKINSGRNSFESIYKSGITKLNKKVAKKMSLKVIAKGVTSESVSSSINSSIAYYPKQIIDNLENLPNEVIKDKSDVRNCIECGNPTSNYPTLIHNDNRNDYYCLCVKWD